MKILIDADGCPVVKLTQSVAKSLKLEVIIFCDCSHHFESHYAKIITVITGKDAVDFELIKYVEPNDIVITQDYGLAAMVLTKGGHALNQNGLIYTKENIDQLLFMRHVNAKVRLAGGRVKGPKKRSHGEGNQFIESFKHLCDLYKEA